MTRKFRDYSTRADAVAWSQEQLRELDPDAYVEGKGLPPGRTHGKGRLGSGQGWTNMLTGVEEGAGRLAGRFLVLDDAGTEVADDEIKRSEDELEPARI